VQYIIHRKLTLIIDHYYYLFVTQKKKPSNNRLRQCRETLLWSRTTRKQLKKPIRCSPRRDSRLKFYSSCRISEQRPYQLISQSSSKIYKRFISRNIYYSVYGDFGRILNLYSTTLCLLNTLPSRFLLRALQQFCDLSPQNLPPLGGSIPDMVSTTGFFVTLQRIYQRKAAADRLIFQGLLSNIILVSIYDSSFFVS
jgi:hypothetical protein